MMGLKTLLLVSLLAVLAVALVEGRRDRRSLGQWTDVDESHRDLWQPLTSVVNYYNNHVSNSDYYFKPSTSFSARRQVFQDKYRYIVDLEMIKTGCRKPVNPSYCDLQPEREEQHKCHPDFLVSHGEVDINSFQCDS